MKLHTLTMKTGLSYMEYQNMKAYLFGEVAKEKGKTYSQGNSIIHHRYGGGLTVKLFQSRDKAGYYHRIMYITLNPHNLLNERSRLLTFDLKENQIDHFFAELGNYISLFPEGLNDVNRYCFDRIDLCLDIRIGKEYVHSYLILANGAYISPRYRKKLYYSVKGKKKLSSKHRTEIRGEGCKIIAYDKAYQLEAQNITDFDSGEAEGILRLELAMEASFLNDLASRVRDTSGELTNCEFMYHLCECSTRIFINFFAKVFFTGDYFKVKTAKKLIKESPYREKTKEQMLFILCRTAVHRSIAAAVEELKEQYPNLKGKKLGRLLQKFNELGLNPYPLQARRGITQLPSFPHLITYGLKGCFDGEASCDGNWNLIF